MGFSSALVGLDLGRISDALVDWITVTQKIGTRRLILAHVIPLEKLEHVAGFAVDKLEEELRREALEKLEAYAARLRERGFDEVEIIEPPVGEPAPALAELAEKHSADYIVVANRGRGLLRSILLGSVSDELANISPVSVLVAKGFTKGGLLGGELQVPPDPFVQEHPIVAAVTRDEYVEAVARDAISIASRTGQRLVLVHVAEEGVENPEGLLEDLRRRAEAAGVEAETIMLQGRPAKKIVELAGKLGARLIIVGRGGAGSPLRGSVSDAVLRYSRMHVLVSV